MGTVSAGLPFSGQIPMKQPRHYNVLDGDVAVCTWTKHFEYIPRHDDRWSDPPSAVPARMEGPKGTNASETYQRIHLNECAMCDTIDQILFESDLPTSALGLGLFETDKIDSLFPYQRRNWAASKS